MIELLGKSKEELQSVCAALGEPSYRAAQIFGALYAQRKLTLRDMTTLPKAFRERLAAETSITLPQVKQRYVSSDGSIRYLMTLPNTEENRSGRAASVEAVFMPSAGRQTICVSTQAGCAVDCQFCLTAQLGLIRNLTAGEILAQVLLPLQEMASAKLTRGKPDPPADFSAEDADVEELDGLKAPTNVVLMGQGEPLLNFDAVMAALRIMLDPAGIGIPPKRATLSTSGIVPGIERLAQEAIRPKLAISLNASNDEQRDKLMPINRKYPLRTLIGACKSYPLRSWEHLTFEYVMLGGLNDSSEDARRVVRLLGPLKSVKVNLIPWNPGDLPYRESSPERIEEFRRVLVDRGVPAFVRYSRGRDVMAACGQLALKDIQSTPLVTVS